MLNAVIAGNIGKDAEVRTAAQTTVTGFNVAVEQRGKDGKKTQWIGCSMWGKRGETLAQYLALFPHLRQLEDVGLFKHPRMRLRDLEMLD